MRKLIVLWQFIVMEILGTFSSSLCVRNGDVVCYYIQYAPDILIIPGMCNEHISLGISRIRAQWFITVMPKVLSIYCACTIIPSQNLTEPDALTVPVDFCLATILLVLFVVGLVRGRSGSRFAPVSTRLSRYAELPIWYMLWQEKAYLLLPIWIAQAVASVRY